MAISFGRKIVDIKIQTILNQRYCKKGSVHLTAYSEGRAYIYQMDKVLLEDALLRVTITIMNESKREFVGRTILR